MDKKYEVKELGERTVPSPMGHFIERARQDPQVIQNSHRVMKSVYSEDAPVEESFVKAGLRGNLFFDPKKTKAAVVTCGGLCPGLNDVIRGIVMTLWHWYGVKDIAGIRYGYSGFAKHPPAEPIQLQPEMVTDIHTKGGTILGSSRGGPSVVEIVDRLQEMDVNILFCIGGDGTLRGAHEIACEALERKVNLAVIGVPKTIDNDIVNVQKSFGFQTAVEQARDVLSCAHVEAKGAFNGVGLVKLMGRDAGFIAAEATRASGDVNFCLIPEIQFPLHGENGFLAKLKERLESRHHAVIAVAEGAGTHLIGKSDAKDLSGNLLHKDVGMFLKNEISTAFKEWNVPVSMKYFDPSYIIRSVPADAEDSIFCYDFAVLAVTAAMEGRTDMMIGFVNGTFTCVPFETIHGTKQNVPSAGRLWMSVLSMTGQPIDW